MKVVIQRTKQAKVTVANKIIGKIDKGLVILVGFTKGDTNKEIEDMIKKIIHLRIFNDENGLMNYSLLDVGESILTVSQFTLYANTKKGRRPSYEQALNPKEAELLYDLFNENLKKEKIKVETGLFGSKMEVEMINDGPVTIILES